MDSTLGLVVFHAPLIRRDRRRVYRYTRVPRYVSRGRNDRVETDVHRELRIGDRRKRPRRKVLSLLHRSDTKVYAGECFSPFENTRW